MATRASGSSGGPDDEQSQKAWTAAARPGRLHDLGRRGAGRDAPADAPDLRGARPDHAEALRRQDAPLLAGGRRPAAPDPGADVGDGDEPGRRREGLRAGGGAGEDARAYVAASVKDRGTR